MTNFFSITGINNLELQHSNILAWLLNSEEEHGFKDSFLKYFISSINKSDFGTGFYKIIREYHNIDLFLINEKQRKIICIENKIKSLEHDNQLERYREYVTEHFKGFDAVYIYLTPDKLIPTDRHWIPLGYETVQKAVEHCLSKYNPSEKIRYFLEDYVSTIWCGVIPESNIEELQNKIKNFIHNYFSKNDSGLWKISDDKKENGNVRLKNSELNRIFPDSEKEGGNWKKSRYYVEIKFEKTQLSIQSLQMNILFTNHPENIEKFARLKNKKYLIPSIYVIISQICPEMRLEEFFAQPDVEEKFDILLESMLSEMNKNIENLIFFL